jgi:hypothetical protein
LGGDARFLSSSEVDGFLREHQSKISELQAAINRFLDLERRSKRRESANTVLNNAKIYFEHHNRARAFEYLFEARGIIDDIERDADDEDRAFVSDWNARASSFEQQCQQQMLDDEIKALLQTPGHHLSTAEFYLKTANYEQATEAFHQAKDAALVLAEPKYLAIRQVQSWFDEWVRSTDDFQTRFDNAVWQAEASRVKCTITSHIQQAQIFFGQRSYDSALDNIHKAYDALKALDDNEALLRVAGVSDFAADSQKTLRELEATFNATIFNDTVRQAIGDCESKLNSAKSLLERHAYARALEDFNGARELVAQLKSDARFKSQQVVLEFLERVQADINSFSANYAASQLADEARGLVNTARSELSIAKTMLDRGAASEAFKHLQEARAKAQALQKNDMLLQLESVVQVLKDVSAAEAEYAAKELSHMADGTIRAASVHLKQSAQFHKVHADAKALEALQEAEKVAVDLLDDAIYASLPAVNDFRTQFQHAAALLKYERNANNKQDASSSKSSSSSSTVTVSSIVGGLIPYPDLRLKPIMVSTDISPKIFNEVKKLYDSLTDSLTH